MREIWSEKQANNDNWAEISFLDVKELYDIAYAAKPKLGYGMKRFNALLAKAEQMDIAYRAQLNFLQAQRYKKVA